MSKHDYKYGIDCSDRLQFWRIVYCPDVASVDMGPNGRRWECSNDNHDHSHVTFSDAKKYLEGELRYQAQTFREALAECRKIKKTTLKGEDGE